jgi:hypothetical protein
LKASKKKSRFVKIHNSGDYEIVQADQDVLEQAVITDIIKDDLDENDSKMIFDPESDTKKEEQETYINENCTECDLTLESELLANLHQKITHDCTLTRDQRSKLKWACPCCSKHYSMTKIFAHIQSCQPKYQEVLRGCPECGKKFNYSTLKGGLSMIKQHIAKGCRIFKPRTFQPHASTSDFSTLTFSTMNSSTMNFSTMNSSTTSFSTMTLQP